MKAQYRTDLPWMKKDMSPTLHKVVDHPREVLARLPDTLRISMLTEEALEGNHIYIKADQVGHYRQTSRKGRLMDVFHRDMDRSDPVVLSYDTESRLAQRQKSKHPIPPEVLAMMVDPPDGATVQIEETGYLENILNDF